MTTYKTDNEMIAEFLFMYCEGKGFLWNMFFGWRESRVLPDGSNLYTFKIPRKIWQMAEIRYSVLCYNQKREKGE